MHFEFRPELFELVAGHAADKAIMVGPKGHVFWCSAKWNEQYYSLKLGTLLSDHFPVNLSELKTKSVSGETILLKNNDQSFGHFKVKSLIVEGEAAAYMLFSSILNLLDFRQWDELPFGLCMINEDLRVIASNRAEYEMMGYTQDEYLNIKTTHLIQEEYRNSKIRNHKKLFSGELKDFYLKEQRRRKDGKLIWIYVYSSIMNHPITGELVRINFTHGLHSGDERRVEKLVLSQHMDLFIKAIPNPLFIKDRNHRFIHINKALCELTGYSKEQLLGKTDFDFFPEHEARVFKQKDEEIFNGSPVVINEEELTNAKGEKRILSTSKHRFEIEGGELKLVGVISDITDIIKTRQLLHEQESLLESINQNIEDAIYRSTPDRRLIYVNRAFAFMFGFENEQEVLSLNSISLYADPARRDELSQKIIHDGYFRNEQVLFKRKDGSTFWGIVSGTLTQGVEAEYYFNGVIRDITEIIKVHDELRLAKQQAEQLNKLKSSFLANMSHEIRTPINGILGLAEIISQQTADDEIKHFVQLQKQSGRRLLETINSILNLSKLEAEGAQMVLNPLEVQATIEENLLSHRHIAQQKGLYLELRRTPEPMIILSDEPLFHQIMNNLIGNAIKFTENGGITISCEKFINRREEAFIEICVIDTGIGISEEFLPLIFSPFEQESTGHKRKYEGNGLGLSITKKYIELLGGNIEVSSKKNQGSTFRVLLPLMFQDS